MKITSVYIENFGKLKKFSFFWEDELTCVVEDNGFGKSTLVAFITAMFYGMDLKSRGRIEDSPRKKYAPWQNGVFGGNLSIEVGGEYFRIERTFGEKKSQDTFAVYEERTGKKTDIFSERIGEELFGVDEETFYNAICIAKSGVKVMVTKQLLASLVPASCEQGVDKAGSNVEDKDAYVVAREKLQQEMKQYKKTGQRGSIDIKKNKVERLFVELMNLEESAKEALAFKQQLAELEERIRNIKSSVVSGPVMAPTEEKEDVKKHEKAGRMNGIVVFVCVFVMAVSIGLGIYVSGVFLIFDFLALFLIMHELRKTQKEVQKEDDSIWLSDRRKQMEEDLDIERDTKVISKRLESLYHEMECAQDLRGKIYKSEEACERVLELKEEIEKLSQEIKEEEERFEVLAKTLELLELAKNEMSMKYYGKIKNNIQYFGEKVGFLGERTLEVDDGLCPYIREGGIRRELDYYSDGTKVLAWLCLRMALVKTIFTKEAPVLIMDDPFIELDKENMLKIQGVLAEMSRDYQILYLTCHDTRRV